MTDPAHPNDLVTLTNAETEFQAGILVAVLKEAGIEAYAFNSMPAVQTGLTQVAVQVRATDVERARAALKQNVADSVDLDWDEIDVGQREDDLPLTTRRGMPLLAKVGFGVALLALACLLVAALWAVNLLHLPRR